MIETRQTLGLRESSERVDEHGNLVVSLNRITTAGNDTSSPVVAVFQFDGDRVTRFWGFAG